MPFAPTQLTQKGKERKSKGRGSGTPIRYPIVSPSRSPSTQASGLGHSCAMKCQRASPKALPCSGEPASPVDSVVTSAASGPPRAALRLDRPALLGQSCLTAVASCLVICTNLQVFRGKPPSPMERNVGIYTRSLSCPGPDEGSRNKHGHGHRHRF